MADSLPQPIKDRIFEQANNDDYEAMPNNFSVTTLLYCIRKAYYKETSPKKPVDLKSAVNFYRGNLWDRNLTQLFKRNQVRSTYRCRNVPVAISGKFDFLDENNTITDLKCPATLFYVKRDGKPSETYRKQVLFYCYTNAIGKGQIMYWDGNECLIYPVEVTEAACKELVEELEAKACQLWTALQTGKAPRKSMCKPEQWECNYCDFKAECNGERQL